MPFLFGWFFFFLLKLEISTILFSFGINVTSNHFLEYAVSCIRRLAQLVLSFA